MWDFIIYLGESAICLAVLFVLYKATMSYETLHRLNRVVLLGMVVLAAVLPLCEIRIVEEVELLPLADAEGDVAMASIVEGAAFDYVALFKSLAQAVFCLGVAFMVVRLAVSQLSVWRMMQSGERQKLSEGVIVTVVDKLPSPFSWFRSVVVAREDTERNFDLILEHELAHVRLRHSWDVLAVDIALCVWWFNPALWLLRRELQNLHEYQADDAVLRKGIDAKTYQLLLIKRAVGARLHSVANCLNHSNLKNRITMMCKKNSSRWSAAKLLLVLPLVAVSLAATATTVYVPKEQNKGNEKFVNEQPVTLDELQNPQNPQKKATKGANFMAGDTVEMTSATGEKFNVRYIGNGSSVLVLIDGKERNLDEISADDIESFTVLKDESATKIYGEKGKNGVILIKTKQAVQAREQQSAQEEAFIKCEKMPTFQGGDLNKFRNWVQAQLVYPKEAKEKCIQGRVIFSFVVEKDGSVAGFKTLQSPDKVLSDEVERVFRLSPKWGPGKQNGEVVRVKYTVPIYFAIKH